MAKDALLARDPREKRARREIMMMMMQVDHSRLCRGNLEERLLSHKSSSEERATKDEEDVGQDRAKHLERHTKC